MKKKLCLLIGFISLIACQKQVDWDLQVQDNKFIVVDARITDVQGLQSIRIFHPINRLNADPVPASGAHVLISSEDSLWQLNEDSLQKGIYTTGATFTAVPGKNYSLFIDYQKKVYTAKTNMVAGSEFQELTYQKNEDNELYHLDWVASAFNAEKPAVWEIFLDWSKVPGYEETDSSLCKARLEFFTLPTLDVSEIFAPEMQKIYFPAGTQITENRYSVTPGYAEFLRTLLLETNWQGGLFNTAPADVITNLSPGARGYFTACSVTTVYLTVK